MSLNLGKLIFNSFHCILFTKLASSDGNKLAVFIRKIWMAIGYGVSSDAALHMIMPHQRIDHILQRAVIWITDLGTDHLAQLILECFLSACFHLPFCKGLLVAALVCVMMIEVIADGMDQTALQTLCAEESAHFNQVSFVAPECPASFNMAVADQEMNVLVRRICMYREQHLITPKESLCKLLCNSECLFVSQFVIILRRKGDRDFIGKVCIFDRLLPEQLSGHENIAGEMVTVTVDAPIEVRCGFDYAFFNLFLLPAEQIVGGAAKLCG